MKQILSIFFLIIMLFNSFNNSIAFSLGDNQDKKDINNQSLSSKNKTEDKIDFSAKIYEILKNYNDKKIDENKCKKMIVFLAKDGCDFGIIYSALSYLKLCKFTEQIIQEYLKGDWYKDFDDLYII